jgi:transposase-like protein
MWLNGVSTRKVASITEELSSVSFSKSAVSDLCKTLDAEIGTWRARDLSAHTYPYIYVDALYEDIRKAGTVTAEGVLIVCGVRDDGKREVLDVSIADTESAATYNDQFCSLKERGLSGVMLVVSDAHAGLRNAIRRYFQGATWQRCQVHFLRDVTGNVSLKRRAELSAEISSIFEQADRSVALAMAAEAADRWRDIAPRAAALLDDGIDQCLSILAFPQEHQIRIRPNTILARLTEEIRRRDRVIGIFPNQASALRLISAICIGQTEVWMTCNAFLDMSLLDVDDEPVAAVLQYKRSLKERRAS